VNEGFAVSTPGSLHGGSGNLHNFDILATARIGGKEETIVLDFVYSTDPVDVSPVSTLIGKLIDTGLNNGFLVAIPTLDRAARSLAQLYHIETIEAENSQEAAERLQWKLRHRAGYIS